MGTHARLSPSNHRWPHCAGSVREEAAYPDIPGDAAIDGTGSHILLEMCMDNAVRADSYLGQTFGEGHEEKPLGWVATADRCDRVQVCLDYIERRVEELRGELGTDGNVAVFSESKSDPGGIFGRTDWNGTADITIIATRHDGTLHTLEVIDYKDGRGWVHVRGNSQLLAYIGGKARLFIASGPELVRPLRPVEGQFIATVVQPKTDDPIRSQHLTSAELIDELEKLNAAATRTDDPDAPLTPDNRGGKGHCQWCKHKPNCSAHSTAAVETVMETSLAPVAGDLLPALASMFDKLSELADDELASLMDTHDAMMSAYDRVQKEVQRRIDAGVSVPGYEMAPGRASHVWAVSDEAVAAALKARKLPRGEIYPQKLASPAQILKSKSLTDRQRKKLEADFVVAKAGPLKLKKVARPAEATAVVMFGDLAPEPTPVPSFL